MHFVDVHVTIADEVFTHTNEIHSDHIILLKGMIYRLASDHTDVALLVEVKTALFLWGYNDDYRVRDSVSVFFVP